MKTKSAITVLCDEEGWGVKKIC